MNTSFGKTLVFSVLGALAAAGGGADDRTSFGMMAVSAGHTLRLNVVYAGIADPDLPPGPCVVLLAFRDASGRVIASSRETLAPGQGASLDLTDEVLSGRATNRLQVWATMTLEQTTADRLPPNPCSPARSRGAATSVRLPPNPCIPTLELFENETGRTVALHPGGALREIVAPAPPVVDERQ